MKVKHGMLRGRPIHVRRVKGILKVKEVKSMDAKNNVSLSVKDLQA